MTATPDGTPDALRSDGHNGARQGTRIRYYLEGRHAHRTPLSYPALAALFADTLERVADPGDADLLIHAHSLDIEAISTEAVTAWRTHRQPLVLLSEEPFWDTIWGPPADRRHVMIDTPHGTLPVVQLNHLTTDIFAFHRLPYYLLTDHRLMAAFGYRFTRNAAVGPTGWKTRLAACPWDVTFMAERRPERYHDIRLPGPDVIGLCAWRTDLAEHCDQGRVQRLGQSWQGGPTRFQLTNWHLDKLIRLDGQTRVLSAVENTHQAEYVSEKLFDAFACGARPLYFASAEHGVHRLGLPRDAWINLYDLPVPLALERMARARIDDAFCHAYDAAQNVLKALFTDPGLVLGERARIGRAVIAALRGVLDEPAEQTLSHRKTPETAPSRGGP